MTILSSNQPLTTQLPPLPSLFLKRNTNDDGEWTNINTSSTIFKEDCHMVLNHDYYHKMSTTTTTTDILLPPILTSQQSTNVASSPVPPSPPYSTCSSALSVSSFPSSPNSSSGNSFSSFSTKKGSIQSLLNSGSELLALEKEEYNFFPIEERKEKKRLWSENVINHNNNKKQKILLVEQEDNRQIKGLRLFSKQVCDKVAEKKTTTYNEVADELAADIQRNNHRNVGIDQKNIRRRVYDALNVLMALDIITKDRKEIKWLGINNNEQEILQQEIKNEELRQKLLLDSIQKNKIIYNDTWNNLNRLNQLVKRNQRSIHHQQKIIHLPFFMIQGKNDIETHYNHGNEACVSTSSSFAIYQDIDILTKIWPTSTTVS